ncbi:MAG: WbqC family protein [Candidatus Bathyarchaeota archaeon]|nr:WbqC family protein [Candidatus Bathyarchaeota archaeon]
MIVAGHQPNYLPWLGFFDKMRRCEIFIVEDNVQFEHQGFTNRNKIMTAGGVKWLSIPVEHANKPLQINEVKIANNAEPNWGRRHWLTLKHSYCKAPYWADYFEFFEDTYEREWNMLVDLNMHLIRGIMRFLKIDKPLVMSSSLGVEGKKTELLIAQCKKVGADVQLAGDGGRDYIDKRRFEEEGIDLVFQEFMHPQYLQTREEVVANLSVVDFLFCTGAKQW